MGQFPFCWKRRTTLSQSFLVLTPLTMGFNMGAPAGRDVGVGRDAVPKPVAEGPEEGRDIKGQDGADMRCTGAEGFKTCPRGWQLQDHHGAGHRHQDDARSYHCESHKEAINYIKCGVPTCQLRHSHVLAAGAGDAVRVAEGHPVEEEAEGSPGSRATTAGTERTPECRIGQQTATQRAEAIATSTPHSADQKVRMKNS